MLTEMPTQARILELVHADFTNAGYEIEEIIIDTRPARIRIIADGDHPLTLDVAAELSRRASEALDVLEGDFPYVLEVSSPGIERPLKTRKHFIRNRGRKVELYHRDQSVITGRVAGIDQDELVMICQQRRSLVLQKISLPEILYAVVQVEFSRPSSAEMQLVDQYAPQSETEPSA